MTTAELYNLIAERFKALPQVKEALEENIRIHSKSLAPEEAIGITERKDYPILTGKDVMIEAEYKGVKGQAFTDAPSDWTGTLTDLMALDFSEDAHARGLLIASINAVMGYYGLCDRMVHCRNDGPVKCAVEVAAAIRREYGDPKILMVGYQPSIIEQLSRVITDVRVLDLNPDNIGQEKFGLIVKNGGDASVMDEAIQWADLILCTGSTVCNGTLADYMETGTEILFYGTTLAGTAALLGLKRICYADM